MIVPVVRKLIRKVKEISPILLRKREEVLEGMEEDAPKEVKEGNPTQMSEEDALKKAMIRTPKDNYINDVSWLNDLIYKYAIFSGKLDLDEEYEEGATLDDIVNGEVKNISQIAKEEKDSGNVSEFIPEDAYNKGGMLSIKKHLIKL